MRTMRTRVNSLVEHRTSKLEEFGKASLACLTPVTYHGDIIDWVSRVYVRIVLMQIDTNCWHLHAVPRISHIKSSEV